MHIAEQANLYKYCYIILLYYIRRMETGRKPRKRKMTILKYWHKLLKEANIETHEVDAIGMDRAQWTNLVKDRMRHIVQFEK